MHFHRKAVSIAAIAILLVLPLGAFVPPGHEKDLPDLDKRRDPQAQPKPLPPAKAAAAQKLRGQIPGLRVEHDGLLQSPKHISSTAGFLSGDRKSVV